MKNIIVVLLFSVIGFAAFAHSKVNSTIPENEAILAEVPEVVTLNFANRIRLIKVEMTHLDHPTVALDLGDQRSFATEFVVPVDQMGAGTYHIVWRGLGIDGHAMIGEFMFTVE